MERKSILNLELKNFRKSTQDWATPQHAECDVFLDGRKISSYSWNPFWNAEMDLSGVKHYGQPFSSKKVDPFLRKVAEAFSSRYGASAQKTWDLWVGKIWDNSLSKEDDITIGEAYVWKYVEPIYPDVYDVESSLTLDALCIESTLGFEGFCANLGYDPDSRKAEKIYFACQEIFASLVRTGKWEELKKLHEED